MKVYLKNEHYKMSLTKKTLNHLPKCLLQFSCNKKDYMFTLGDLKHNINHLCLIFCCT